MTTFVSDHLRTKSTKSWVPIQNNIVGTSHKRAPLVRQQSLTFWVVANREFNCLWIHIQCKSYHSQWLTFIIFCFQIMSKWIFWLLFYKHSWKAICRELNKCFTSEIDAIYLSRGSPIGFSGCGISLILTSWFVIRNRNKRDSGFRSEAGARNRYFLLRDMWNPI